MIGEVTEHEYLPLTLRQPIERPHHRAAPGQPDGAMFGRRVASRRWLDWERVERYSASCGALTGPLAIDAGVDKNAREPHLERMFRAIGVQPGEGLDEGVLNRLVGIGGVTKIKERDARGPALVRRDQPVERLAGFAQLAVGDEGLDAKCTIRRSIDAVAATPDRRQWADSRH